MSTLGIHAPGLAQQKAGKAAVGTATQERDEATNRAILTALLQRRAETARSPADAKEAEGRRYALDFLDRQIAKVRKQIGD